MKKSHGRRPHIIPCGVALIRRGREFLIAQRNADDTFGSYWEFPGGKKNPGETYEACIAREAQEELGIEVCVGTRFISLRRKINSKIILLNFYLCSHVKGDPRAIECQRFSWVDVEKLNDYRFPPANDRVIERLVHLCKGSHHPQGARILP